MSLLQVEHVSRSFGDHPANHPALRDIDFAIAPGEIVGVIGRSGAGKTTLLRCLCGLERPDRGRIVFEGEDMTRLDEAGLIRMRRRIGLVFQHFNLLTSRTVAGNVALPLEIAGVPAQARQRRVQELLDLVGLGGFAGRRVAQLSGGQKQRVGIARALAAAPALLLCDEATSALDPETTTSILDLLRDINRTLGLTVLMITHEMAVIRSIAQRVLVLDHGTVVEDGIVRDILRRGAAHPVTRRFLGEEQPRLPADIASRLTAVAGPDTRPLVRLVLSDDAERQPILSTLGRRFGIDAVLLHADIGETGGHRHAELQLMLSNESDDALRYLAAASRVMEVTGHVAADR